MYEVGTGLLAAEIESTFDITKVSFSSNGRYLCLGSKQGCVSVWTLGNHLHEQVSRILEHMSLDKDFWLH
jgi:hypothetical protein